MKLVEFSMMINHRPKTDISGDREIVSKFQSWFRCSLTLILLRLIHVDHYFQGSLYLKEWLMRILVYVPDRNEILKFIKSLILVYKAYDYLLLGSRRDVRFQSPTTAASNMIFIEAFSGAHKSLFVLAGTFLSVERNQLFGQVHSHLYPPLRMASIH